MKRTGVCSILAVVCMIAIALLSFSCSAPSSAAAGGKLNVVVLCSSCGIPQAEQTPHLILLDQDTTEVWAYKELDQQPVSLGRLAKLGTPVQK